MSTSDTKPILGENLVVKVGSVIGVLAMIIAVSWWASSVQSDLNTIKSTLAGLNKFDSIASRVERIEMYGSPKTAEIEKQLQEVKKEFDLHRATTMQRKEP